MAYNSTNNKGERTFLMIKPDGVQRGLVGNIIKRFEIKGFKLIGLKFMWVSMQLISQPTFSGVLNKFNR